MNALNAFRQSSGRSLSNLLAPRASLRGFELVMINFTGDNWISAAVWESREGARVTYHTVTLQSAEMAQENMSRHITNSSRLSGTGDRELHHSTVETTHGFHYVEGNMHISVYFEDVVGMSVPDMVRHIDLVSA
jgi:hypothetical protein